MSVKLITYDLNKETKRPDILSDIKAYEGWARLSESSYAVDTKDSVDKIYEKLSKHIDGNDYLYVITLKKPWNGFGLKKVNDWLESNLTY